jgi:hypothetical protein
MRLVRRYAYSHRRATVRVRLGVGIWLLGLSAFLCYSGYWWGALLIAPAALHFYLGYHLQHNVQS